MKFSSGYEMMRTILSGKDLYSPSYQAYVFAYNNDGAICVYPLIDPFSAAKLAWKSKAYGERWSAYMGAGGYIYDDPFVFCKEFYHKSDWIDTENALDYFKTELPEFRFWDMVERECAKSELDYI